MAFPNSFEVCRAELFTDRDELAARFSPVVVEKVLRVREMYNWFLANPAASDRDFVAEECSRHGIHRTTAYADLSVVKSLLPALGKSSREFHRWRANEMLMDTFRMAQKRKDSKIMERAASSYYRLNRADVEEDSSLPLDELMPQPFTATNDPRVLGIEPIPDIDRKISDMIAKYRKESMDIEDVEFEDVDLEFDSLFPVPAGADNGVDDNVDDPVSEDMYGAEPGVL